MISLYKKYHIAYWCVGIALIIGMLTVMILFWRNDWYFPFLVVIPALLLVVVDAKFFTRLASKKLSEEVLTLFNECQANRFINDLKSLFEGKTKGSVVSLYNTLLARGYSVIDDYDSAYECCQKIKARNYMAERSKSMIDYYLSKDRIEEAQQEMEELKKLTEKMRNPQYKEGSEISIKNAEYVIRIKQGNYEGAEEYYRKMLDTITPLFPLTKVSYSYALGRLLILKGEPERAKEYLQTAYDSGGDTKYKKHAGELLQTLQDEKDM